MGISSVLSSRGDMVRLRDLLNEANVGERAVGAFEQDDLSRVVPMLYENGIPPDTIVTACASAKDLTIGMADLSAEQGGKDWVVADGIFYMVNPWDEDLVKEVIHRVGEIKSWGIISKDLIHSVLDHTQNFISSEQEEKREGKHKAEITLARIIEDGLALGCSDIHFQPMGKECRIRFRHNGDLIRYTKVSMPLGGDYLGLVNTLLGHAGKNAGEFNKPVSAKISWMSKARQIDIRLEMCPVQIASRDWPKIVLRILSRRELLVDLDHLGLPSTEKNNQLMKLKELASRPHGMVLVTGPTGSGKTTTLMAALRYLAGEFPSIAIDTLEDPVEIESPGVSQIEVNRTLSFADGLRSLMRQDPDVVFVGEMRDKETLNLGIQAAMTGHMIFSTLHTNSAVEALNRMANMGADMTLVADILLGVQAQRIVKKVCENCRHEYQLGHLIDNDRSQLGDSFSWESALQQKTYAEFLERYGSMKTQLSLNEKVVVGARGGCDVCNGTGYKDRHLVSELMVVDSEIRQFIGKPDAINLTKQYQAGLDNECSHDIWEHGLLLVKEKVTSLDVLERKLGPRPISKRHSVKSEVESGVAI